MFGREGRQWAGMGTQSTCLARVFLDPTAYLGAETTKDARMVGAVSRQRANLVGPRAGAQCLLGINDLGRHFALVCA